MRLKYLLRQKFFHGTAKIQRHTVSDIGWRKDFAGFVIHDRYVIFFERRLFGLRWAKRSEGLFPPEGLALSGTWNSWNSDLSSRCAAAVYGDNRTGTVEGYASGDAPEVHRANLEADYILDLYTLDGIEALPQSLDRKSVV